jgi:hypothetical protein
MVSLKARRFEGSVPAKAPTARDRPGSEPDRAPWHSSKYVRFGALGIVAAAAAVTIALVLDKGSSPAPTPGTVTSVGPVVLSASGLKALVADLNQRVYWAGPVVGQKYELTRNTANDVYVRYLPPGVKAGEGQGQYAVIATYPYKHALAALKAAPDSRLFTVSGAKGAVAEIERGTPTSVHVAFPHVNFQIEVYNPYAPSARRLARSGALRPVP